MIFSLILFFNLVFYIQCQSLPITYVSGSCPQSQYLSSTDLVCVPCSPNATQSPNGLSCVCMPGYFYTKNGGGRQVLCQQCSNNRVPSQDGWSCIACPTTTSSASACPSCPSNQALITSNMTGSQLDGTCQPCSMRYMVSNNQCTLCLNRLNTNSNQDCTCSSSSDTTCIIGPLNLIANNSVLIYDSASVTSGYLLANMVDSMSLCRSSVDAGCQSIASMCVMDLYNIADYESGRGGPCGMYRSVEIPGSPYSKTAGFPWLYYPVSSNLNSEINHQYSRGEILQIILAAYDISGQFLGYRNATQDGTLQLCSNSIQKRSATYRFGTHYLETCSIMTSQLFNQSQYSPTFYDPYLSYTDANTGVIQLFPIPIKINLIQRPVGNFPNQQFSPNSFILTRRLFLVDNVGSVSPPYFANKTGSFVRYASSMRLVVVKRFPGTISISTDGKINVPYLEVNMTTAAFASSAINAPLTFEVVYTNEAAYTSGFQYSVSVAMGVLSALAGLYAILRSFFWCRRSGISGFEGLVLLKTLAYACASISNVFFVVIFGISLYFLLLYKNQTLFSIIPPDDDTFFLAYLICAFLLKLLEIIHIFVTQCTIDIFLIDWERPKNVLAPKQVIERSKFDHTEYAGDQAALQQEKVPFNTGVSIWRSYFIANEWNEIQTYRKTSLIFNLIIVLLFMEVIGFTNITRFDPFVIYNLSGDAYRAPYYRMFRFAVIVSIFGITGFLQWLYTVLIYERVVEDKLRNYVDLCSVANVSVFILAHRQFGYYIHGRTVHGTSDVSLAEMYVALQKENSGSCAKRGLENDSMQQTYIMALPSNFRDGLDTVYRPSGSRLGPDSRNLQYLEVNKFLDKFINRTNNPRITFRYQDRKFFEDVFDGEFEDNSIEGRFYRDNGTSFGNVLFYGQELALITFDILLFCVVDLILQNVVFDAFITWGIVTILKMIRNGCGSHNLAQKTLVDRRFLI